MYTLISLEILSATHCLIFQTELRKGLKVENMTEQCGSFTSSVFDFYYKIKTALIFVDLTFFVLNCYLYCAFYLSRLKCS